MTAVPESPYKGLAPFADSELDALLFFGREREREAVAANLVAERLTILHGPSGVGKSSLLRAGVAQRLRALGDGAVVVHDAWADAPAEALVRSIHAACGELGPTAGIVDALAAAAQRHGRVYLLLDQFEDCFLYHGVDGPLADALPELLRRPGLRVNVLLALRDDALGELDALAGRVPGLFSNLLRLDRLDRVAARRAIVAPLERYGELAGGEFGAEPELVEAVLDEVAAGRVDFSGAGEAPPPRGHVEAAFLQLVLERLWAEERAAGSPRLRLTTLERLGGAEPIVREHVHGALDRLPQVERDAAARVVRQLVTASGAKISHTAEDLAEYAELPEAAVRPLLSTLVRERVLRGVDGSGGGPGRFEIFHDVLAAPVLAWRALHEVERERRAARRERRRLIALAAAALVALAVVTALAVFAFTQRSSARAQARRADGRRLAAQALAGLSSDQAHSLALALRAAEVAPGAETANVLRTSLLAMRERRVLRLGGRVTAASFAPRGGRLLVASSDGAATLFRDDGSPVVELPHGAGVTRAAWSGDGRLVALGREDGSVTVLRAADGRAERTLATPAPVAMLGFAGDELVVGGGAHLRLVRGGGVRALRVDGAVVAAAPSPDGRLVAVATRRRGRITAAIVDARTGRVRATLRERGVRSLAFSPDGRLVATGSTDRTARLWSARTGRLLHVLQQQGHVLAERFSPDGRTLVTASADGSAAVWDVASGERRLLLVGATGAADDATFSPDATQIAVAFADRSARIYDAQDGRLLATLTGHAEAATGVSYDPAGGTVVTAGDDGTARLWDANAANVPPAVDRRRGAVRAYFAGDRVVTIAGREARVLELDGRLLQRIRTRADVTAAATHGAAIALAGPSGVTAVAYAPDGTLVTGARDGVVRIGRHSIRVAAAVARLSAAGDRVAVRTADGAVRVYGLDGRLLSRVPGRATLATLSPDGALVATAAAREADLRDAATGKLLHRLRGHRSLVTDARFSPDGARLVTASDDHDARIWDARSGRLLHVLRGHFFAVRSASFSPDGRWVVTSSQFSAGLWDAASGRLVLYLLGAKKPLTGAAFSADGVWIVTGSEDGTARLFRCDVCRSLAGVERVARQRLRAVGAGLSAGS